MRSATSDAKRSRKASITVVEPEMEKLKGAEKGKKKKGTAGKIGAGVAHVLGACFYLLTVCCVLGGEGRPVKTDGRRVGEQEKVVRIRKVESRASEKTARSKRTHR